MTKPGDSRAGHGNQALHGQQLPDFRDQVSGPPVGPCLRPRGQLQGSPRSPPPPPPEARRGEGKQGGTKRQRDRIRWGLVNLVDGFGWFSWLILDDFGDLVGDFWWFKLILVRTIIVGSVDGEPLWTSWWFYDDFGGWFSWSRVGCSWCG